MRGFLENHPLLGFMLLAYAITWSLLGPCIFLWQHVYNGKFQVWMLVFVPGAWGPTIAALIMVRMTKGREGVQRLLLSFLNWRHHPAWYALAIFFPILITITAATFMSADFSRFEPAAALVALPLFFALALPFGPLGEELGWRGFAMPELMARSDAFLASVTIGTCWTFWHAPLFWLPGASIPAFMDVSPTSIAIYWAYLTGNSLVYSAIWLKTGGSVLLAVILHGFFNASENIVFSGFKESIDNVEQGIYFWSIGLTWLIGIPLLMAVTKNSGTKQF